MRIQFIAAALVTGVAAYVVMALAIPSSTSWLPGAWRVRSAVLGSADVVRARHRAQRLRSFAADPTPTADVLFIGSSTIEALNVAQLFDGARVKNRGVGDEPLALMLERLDDTLARVRPQAICIYAASVDARRPTGPNDAWRSPSALITSLESALDRILAAGDRITVTLVGVLPETLHRPELGDRIERINSALQRLAGEHDRLSFVETHVEPLVDRAPAHDVLRSEHAIDRIHLGSSGQEILSRLLASDPLLQPHLRPR